MKTFSQFITEILNEEVHENLLRILNSDHPAKVKLSSITREMRSLISQNQDTGILNGTPKKGSSRGVLFPSEHKRIVLDGVDATAPTAVKIAFPGYFDPFTKDPYLLGEHQNMAESDSGILDMHSILRKKEDGSYETNPDGILTPHFDNHDQHHWVMQGFAPNLTKKKFRELTKRDSHPKGLDFEDVYNHILNEYNVANGMHATLPTKMSPELLDAHPLVSNIKDFIHNSGIHPGDNRLQNWGVWQHPITKQEYPLIRDYGFSSRIAMLYEQAKKRMFVRR